MKKRKKIILLIMALTLIVILSTTAFAAELNQNGAVGNSEVKFVSEATWEATIPAYIVPSESTIAHQINTYAVTLENALIPNGKELTAKVTYSGKMVEGNGVELPYSLYDESGNAITSGAKILSKTAGSPNEASSASFTAALNAKAKYAGVYTDTATFTFDVAEKTYSIDEINADEHLYPIGKTKPEYVVAKFNEDFSEATIFKNGADSDGLMKNFTPYNTRNPFYAHKDILTTAIVKDNVTTIGNDAFCGCTELENITIENDVTSIGSGAFSHCTSLTSVIIPNNVTTIGSYAFNMCNKLTSITIPNNVTTIGSYAFVDCSSLTSVTIGNSLNSISEHAFQGCTSLTSVNIPNSVTAINDFAFGGCTSLTSVTISHNVTSIGNTAFNGCTSLTSVNIPNSVTNIGATAFARCTSLTNVNIPDSVTNIDMYTFEDCTSLTSVNIPDSVTAIGERAFSNCTSLTSITISHNVTSIGNTAFNGCTSLTTIYGASGSYAETYAKNNGYTFVAQ